MNGVIYARYSDHTQREESIEGQIRICKQYAEEIGVTIIHCYIDRAQTAKTDDRIEFQKMIRDTSRCLPEKTGALPTRPKSGSRRNYRALGGAARNTAKDTGSAGPAPALC